MNQIIQKVFLLLKFTYGLVPIVAGLDKFTNLLTDWSQYASLIEGVLPLETSTFIMIIGVVEIVAGILVLIKPKIGSLIVMVWLIAIALVLIFSGKYFDIAVRDIVMAIGAYTLNQISTFNTIEVE